MNAFPFQSDPQEIDLGELPLSESCLMVIDDLPKILVILSVQIASLLRRFGLPVGAANIKDDVARTPSD
jgi:hypothetical protein